MEIVKPPTSPFYARAYGGFTRNQENFFLQHLKDVRDKNILDPMGGQGFSLSALARRGANIWLCDVNPAPLLLASLRDPETLLQSKELCAWAKDWIGPLKRRRSKPPRAEYIDGWIAPTIRDELAEYGAKMGLGLFNDGPFSYSNEFWKQRREIRFLAALPVLAARSLTLFRKSDNVTWLKPGGLPSQYSLHECISDAIDRYSEFALVAAGTIPKIRGEVAVQRMNVEKEISSAIPRPHVIITSPPYANRLDYSRMWGPELEVLSAVCGVQSEDIKGLQIGSTVVRGTESNSIEERLLPSAIRVSLEEIRSHSSAYSGNYYYPFFRNYALSMFRSLMNIAASLRKNGQLIVFVRDTVRKDTLFATGRLVTEVLLRRGGLRLISKERHVIRGHVGLLRKSAPGVHGLAQQEWWLVFKKGER